MGLCKMITTERAQSSGVLLLDLLGVLNQALERDLLLEPVLPDPDLLELEILIAEGVVLTQRPEPAVKLHNAAGALSLSLEREKSEEENKTI